MYKLSIVIPCFNNSENITDLQIALEALSKRLEKYELEIILVDDGSGDDTFNKLKEFSKTSFLKIVIVKLTGNFGSYNAFLAGLNQGTGDVYAQVHPDIQDPPKHLSEMLPFWEKGIAFVIGQRVAREDNNASQYFAKFYHLLMKRIALPHIPKGGYDLIVFDKKLRDHVVEINESNTNLVYLISWLKYPYVTVPITRVSRKKGKSQWTFSKKSKLMADSIVGFSYTPIRFITLATIVTFFLSVFFFIYLYLASDISTTKKIVSGMLLILGNILLIAISIISEYLWRTLEAARRRPPFIIEEVIKK